MEDREVRCPRCDYDLVGEVSRWNHEEGNEGDCCPWKGTCSECGLEFVWGDLYRPELTHRWWFYENRKGIAPGAVVGTLWRAACVLPLWRAMRLENEVRLGRAVVWVSIVGGVAFGAMTIAAIFLGLASSWDLLWAVERWGEVFLEILKGDGARDLPPWSRVVGPGFVMCPVVLLLLPFSRAQSKVAPRHVARGAAYSVAAVVAAAMVGGGMVVVGVAAEWLPDWGGDAGGFSYAGIPRISTQFEFWGLNPFGDLFGAMEVRRPKWAPFAPSGRWVVLAVIAAWLGTYWLVALRTGFRMKDWLAVWASMMACSVVLAVLLLMFDESFLRGVW